MPKEKEEIGKSFDELEDFNFDFDTDFDGGFFSEEPPPATKREAVSRSAKAAGKSFVEEFDPRDSDKVFKFVESAIPSAISNEYSTLVDLKDSIINELNTTGPEIKRNANKLLKTMNKYMPKNKFGEKMSGGIDKLISATESDDYVGSKRDMANRETILEQSISNMLESVNANNEKNRAEDRIREEINYRKDLNQLEMTNHVVANLDRLVQFNYSVTGNYYKKSLELQYRLLDNAGQQLELNKLAADTFKNQLESIIKNTSLPDVIKMRNTEVMKQVAGQRMAEKALSGLFGEGTRFDRMKNRLAGIAKDKIRGVNSTLSGAVTGIEMGEGMNESLSAMGGKSGMAGSILGENVRDLLGRMLGDELEKNEKTSKKLAGFQEFMSDPRSYFLDALDKSYDKDSRDKGFFGNFFTDKKRDFLRTMADATNTSLRDGFISVDKKNLDEPAVLDNRYKDSVIKTIPNLLSEILFESAGIKSILSQYTGMDPVNVSKKRLDAVSGKLVGEDDLLDKLKNRFGDEAKSGGGAYNIRRATGTILGNGKGKLKLEEEERAEIDRAIAEYILEGGKVNASMFDDKKLLSKLGDKKLIKKVFRLKENFKKDGTDLERSKARSDFNNYTDRALTSIRKPGTLIETMMNEGNVDLLEKMGIIKISDDGRPVVDNAKYKKLISDSFYKESLNYVQDKKYESDFDKQRKKELEREAALRAKGNQYKEGFKNAKEKTKNFVSEKFKPMHDSEKMDAVKNVYSTIRKETNSTIKKVEESKIVKDIKDELTHNVVMNEIKAAINGDTKVDLNKLRANVYRTKIRLNKDTMPTVIKKYHSSKNSLMETIDQALLSPERSAQIGMTISNNIDKATKRLTTNGKEIRSPEEAMEELIETLKENTESTIKNNKLTEEEIKATTVKFNDKDKNGLRDGSYQEKMGKVFRTGPKDTGKKTEAKDEKEDKSSGLIKTILGVAISGLSSVVTGLFGGMTSLLGTLGGSVLRPVLGLIAAAVPSMIKMGFGMAGSALGAGMKGIKSFFNATKGTRGLEKKIFGGIGKKALSKLPMVGLLAGGYMGYQMLKDGDTLGGMGTMLSSLLAQIPGIGTGLSFGLDALLGLRNNNQEKEYNMEEELANKQREMEERNAIQKKAADNHWEKESNIIQNNIDRQADEQSKIKAKLAELENDKYQTDSKDKLKEKQRQKLKESEAKVSEAIRLRQQIDSQSASIAEKIKARDTLSSNLDKGVYPLDVQPKLRSSLARLNLEIETLTNKNNEMKKIITDEEAANSKVSTVASPQDRLKVLEKARAAAAANLEKETDPNKKLALANALVRMDESIHKVKGELQNSLMTQEINNNLNKDNPNYQPENKNETTGESKSESEIENERRTKLLEDRIAELNARKEKVNNEAKATAYQRYGGSSTGFGEKSLGGDRYLYSGAGSRENSYNGGPIEFADEETIARNSYKGGDVKKIIQEASNKAGVDPIMMQVMAAKESAFKTDARPRQKDGTLASSAVGLYQFLDSTWKETVGKYGKKYGMDLTNSSRLDPEDSTLMAAEYLKNNLNTIKSVKSKPNVTDAYLTHFLGAGGAKNFLSADINSDSRNVLGAGPVNANPGIFYGNGRIRTIKEAYDVIAKQLAKTAGDFGIKIDKADIGGSGEGFVGNNEVKPGSNEIYKNTAVTGGLNTSGAKSPEASMNNNKQDIYNNGIAANNKVVENKQAEIDRAKQELESRQNQSQQTQTKINNAQPYNNANDNSYKQQIVNNDMLTTKFDSFGSKLDTIANNTGSTVKVLGEIKELLAGQAGKTTTPPRNKPITEQHKNAVSTTRGATVNN